MSDLLLTILFDHAKPFDHAIPWHWCCLSLLNHANFLFVTSVLGQLVQALMLLSGEVQQYINENPALELFCAQTQVDTTIPGNYDKSDTSWLSVAVLMSYQHMGIANFVRPCSICLSGPILHHHLECHACN